MYITTLEILTNDLPATILFYTQLLELKLIKSERDSATFSAGHSTLRFSRTNLPTPRYHFAFNFPHNKMTEAVDWATKRFELIKNSDDEVINQFESWNAQALYFYDNNQNILEFIARFDLTNTIKDPFNNTAILSISEIGIVADEPLLLTSQLMETNELHFFEKSTRMDDFIPLGDDNGLLIVVANNRPWFPTPQLAQKDYVKVQVISASGAVQELVFNGVEESV